MPVQWLACCLGAGVFCCLPNMPVGHAHYDFFFDVRQCVPVCTYRIYGALLVLQL